MSILKFVWELLDWISDLYIQGLVVLFVLFGGKWSIGSFFSFGMSGLLHKSKRRYRGMSQLTKEQQSHLDDLRAYHKCVLENYPHCDELAFADAVQYYGLQMFHNKHSIEVLEVFIKEVKR